MRSWSAKALHSPFQDQSLYDTRFIFGPYQRYIGKGSIGYPHFGPIQFHMIALILKICDHIPWVRTVIRLGKPKATYEFPRSQPGKVLFLLLLRSECENRVHYQGALHRGGGAYA